ncbi:uncharacterized protein LOC113307754 [Papaver somniferum]|uniref:uncharacterized protein LOC113307754 n=1 Tax=Papaver somniferum TaxID=3469 RepID=UPI000E6F85E5|nr:uncharacterized protein LOC113307754 [Papaver somniferum]
MANQELILGHNRELNFGQLGLEHHNNNHVGYDLGGQINDLDLGHTTEYHDQSFSLQQNYENSHSGLDLCQNQNPEYEHGGSVDEQHQIVIAEQHYDLGFGDDHELVVSDGNELEQNLDLVVHQNQEMGLEASDDLVQQHHLVVSTPVVQSRELGLNPNYELALGQEFPDVKSCRRALRDAAIALHFEIQTVKSDKTRFTAKCASEGCPWRVHAAKLPGVPTFTIRTINEGHTCGGITHLGHQQASVQWVANSVEQRLRENPDYKPKEILEEIHRAHGITLSYKQAWRGKERVMAAVRGSFEEGYRLLPQYCDQIKRTNPGSIASVYANPQDSFFQRLFVSFQASIFGFVNACRPLLGLDRTLLKNKYLGTLLFATGFDGDGALFPLAFGVVDEKSDDNWMWFLSELHNLLEANMENMPMLTIISDS